MSKRKEIIEEIIFKLKNLKENPSFNDKIYAIKENIYFFEVIRNMPRYVIWILSHVKKIDQKNLLEINDLLPEYDLEMHEKLIEMERRPSPGLIKPAVNQIIINLENNKENILIFASFGSGGMEVERQIIEYCSNKKIAKKIIFLAIDQSTQVHNLAIKNLNEFESIIETYNYDLLDYSQVTNIINNSKRNYIVIHCLNNIFNLKNQFPEKFFDLSYHTHFKHHLSKQYQEKFNEVINKLSKKVIEYDGYKNWLGMIPQSIIGWTNPIFLNAEIFSNIRYSSYKEIENYIKKCYPNSFVLYSKIGFYMLEYIP